MAELKPCPFCGRKPIVDDCGDHRYFVRCKCGIAQDKLYMQKCDAVRRWNTRKTGEMAKDMNVPSNDCISRQAAIDALGGNVRVRGRENAQTVMEYIRECAGRIRSLPSVQAEPTSEQVKEYCDRRCLRIITNDLYHSLITEYSAPPERKKGRWINAKCKDGTTAHKCSECRKLVGYSVSSLTWFDFCPWCGADMSGKGRQ